MLVAFGLAGRDRGQRARCFPRCTICPHDYTFFAYSECNAMAIGMSAIHLARHTETAWNLTGQLTGATDLPLSESGERSAQRLGARLKGLKFAKILSSPLQRARQTCELSGFWSVTEIDPDLVEWNYGRYEGRREEDIRAERPGWSLLRDGCPEGETPEQVCARADRVISRMCTISGNVLLFTSGHFIQVL